MRWLLVWLVALAGLLAGCGARNPAGAATAFDATASATATASPVPLIQYVNPAYPYALSYPAGWKAVTSNPDAISFQGVSGRQISVIVQPVPVRQPPLNLSDYADEQVEALRASMPNLVELQRLRVGLPNKEAGVEVDVSWGTADGAAAGAAPLRARQRHRL